MAAPPRPARPVRRALLLAFAATCCVAGGGLGFAAAEHVSDGTGLYWAVTTATTVGYGDVAPRTTAGRWIAVAVMLATPTLLGLAVTRLAGLRVTAWLRAHHSALHDEAARGRRIAADLYRHETGRDHPDAAEAEDDHGHAPGR